MILNLSDAERRIVEAFSGGLDPQARSGRILSVAEIAAATGLPQPEFAKAIMSLWERGWLICLDGTPWRPESDCLLGNDALAALRDGSLSAQGQRSPEG